MEIAGRKSLYVQLKRIIIMSPEIIQSQLEKIQEKIEKMEVEGTHAVDFKSLKSDALLLLEELGELAQTAAEEADAEPEPSEHEES